MQRDYEGRLMRNKSFTYVLPMLALYLDVKTENLLNTFIKSADKPELTNHLFLLYKFSGAKIFLEYEDFLEKEELFELSYDPDKYHVMFVFKIPDSHKEIYDKFLNGKYSEFPQDYKVHIFKFHGIKDPNHRVAQVLFKHPDLREEWEEALEMPIPDDAEVSSVPDMNLEIYTEKFKYAEPLKPDKNPFE